MRNKIKAIIIILVIMILVIIGCIYIINTHKEEEIKVSTENTAKTESNEQKENVLIFDMGEKEKDSQNQTEPEPEPEPVKDPATVTQEIYNLNAEIGTLYIPKTDLTTPIYCTQTTSMMEKMPCFIYATGELNKPGIVFITGHNKRNGKLFSNNKKLDEGDEFYFKDYTGVELKYTIISKFITNSEDTSFLNTETDKPVMILSCCTDASNNDRIIILGRAD